MPIILNSVLSENSTTFSLSDDSISTKNSELQQSINNQNSFNSKLTNKSKKQSLNTFASRNLFDSYKSNESLNESVISNIHSYRSKESLPNSLITSVDSYRSEESLPNSLITSVDSYRSKKTVPYIDTNNTNTNNKDTNNTNTNNKDTNNINTNNTNTNNIDNTDNKDYNKSDRQNKNISSNRSHINNKSLDYTRHIDNKIFIDVAVLCQEYTNVISMCNDNIINLDEISVSEELFQSIFYPYHENFGLNKDFILNNKEYIFPYISFLPEFRRVTKKKFYLLEEIIANIERDLNISRNCFTKETLVELTKEMISIQTLCDINCCSVLSSLSWQNILEIIKNYKLIKNCSCENKEVCSCLSDVIPICVINIIFKTPTLGVKDTIIRFNYRITDL